METRTIIILSCFIFALVAQESYGLNCYQCTDCKDPFDKNAAGVTTTACATGSCMKTKGSFMGVETVQRDCAPTSGAENKCAKQSVAGVDASVCFCSGDLCNSATTSTISITTVLSIVAAVFMYKNFA